MLTPQCRCYRVQRGCWNCRYVLFVPEYCGDLLFCTFASLPRPACGNAKIGEGWPDDPGELLLHDFEAWLETDRAKAEEAFNVWSRDREVDGRGLCDLWRTRDNDES